MKNQLQCLLSSFVIALIAGGAFAADTRTWTDATGNHKWSDENNWDPKVAGNCHNVFPAGDWTVDIDDGSTLYYHSLVLQDGTGTVTLTGDSAREVLSATGGYIKIPAGRELNIDGPSFSLSGADFGKGGKGFINGTLRLSSGYILTGSGPFFNGDAKVIVDGGRLGNPDPICTFTFTNNATLTINGGVAAIHRGLYRSPDPPCESIVRVRMTGGTYWNSDPGYAAYTTGFGVGAHFENNGGTVIWGRADDTDHRTNLSSEPSGNSAGNYGQGAAFPELLPSVGSVLDIPRSSTSASICSLQFAVDGDYDVGGTIYVTNNTDVASGNIYFSSANIALRGGATIYANAIKVNGNVASVNDLDIARLNLGIGGFRRYNSQSVFQYINFIDGIVFGAWGGDVPGLFASSSTERVRTYLNGPVVYDTQDCFEPATPRTINMDRLYLNEVTELKATGGGTAALYPAAKWAEEFRTIEVADGTTLAFCTNQLAGLKAMNLKLGANATLKINMKNGDYVDASATAEFGEGAKIVVTDVPATLAEGTLYPVYFAPAGTDPDLSKIEYADGDWPVGWFLGKTGSAVYLTDGKIKAYDESRSGSNKIWSGAGSDNVYANSDNWISNSVPGEAVQAFFKGYSNTVVSVAAAAAVRYFSFQNCGPFIFSGLDLTFTYPYQKASLADSVGSQTITSSSKFPIVIANQVKHKVTTGDPSPWAVFKSTGEGSLSLTGGYGNTRPIVFGGDIRIGGAWETECLRVVTESYLHRSRLTVLPEATLTVTGQYGDFNEYGRGALAIATNAVATISGTEWQLTGNNTHYVDGALAVTCPLVPQGRQVFRGDGTLTLSGGVSSAPGGVRIEGNLKLVPSNWTNDVELSVKDNVTIAPTADWTFGGDATLDIVNHSTLTLATGGHKVTLENPVESEGGRVAVTGGGTLELAVGTELCRVTCSDGATLSVAGDSESAGGFVDVLTVREDDDSIAFSSKFKVNKRVDKATGRTIYSVKPHFGVVLIMK